MGLIVNIYRDQHDSELNAFHGYQSVVVLNVEGPFEPTEDIPAAMLEHNGLGDPIIVPFPGVRPGVIGPMYGGTIADTSDSRWREAVGGYHGLPIHDRYETVATYDALSR